MSSEVVFATEVEGSSVADSAATVLGVVAAVPAGALYLAARTVGAAVDQLRHEMRTAKEEERRKLEEQWKQFEAAQEHRQQAFRDAERQFSGLEQVWIARDLVLREELSAKLLQLQRRVLLGAPGGDAERLRKQIEGHLVAISSSEASPDLADTVKSLSAEVAAFEAQPRVKNDNTKQSQSGALKERTALLIEQLRASALLQRPELKETVTRVRQALSDAQVYVDREPSLYRQVLEGLEDTVNTAQVQTARKLREWAEERKVFESEVRGLRASLSYINERSGSESVKKKSAGLLHLLGEAVARAEYPTIPEIQPLKDRLLALEKGLEDSRRKEASGEYIAEMLHESLQEMGYTVTPLPLAEQTRRDNVLVEVSPRVGARFTLSDDLELRSQMVQFTTSEASQVEMSPAEAKKEEEAVCALADRVQARLIDKGVTVRERFRRSLKSGKVDTLVIPNRATPASRRKQHEALVNPQVRSAGGG